MAWYLALNPSIYYLLLGDCLPVIKFRSFGEGLCPGCPGEGTKLLLLAALSPGQSLLVCQLPLFSSLGICQLRLGVCFGPIYLTLRRGLKGPSDQHQQKQIWKFESG